MALSFTRHIDRQDPLLFIASTKRLFSRHFVVLQHEQMRQQENGGAKRLREVNASVGLFTKKGKERKVLL